MAKIVCHSASRRNVPPLRDHQNTSSEVTSRRPTPAASRERSPEGLYLCDIHLLRSSDWPILPEQMGPQKTGKNNHSTLCRGLGEHSLLEGMHHQPLLEKQPSKHQHLYGDLLIPYETACMDSSRFFCRLPKLSRWCLPKPNNLLSHSQVANTLRTVTSSKTPPTGLTKWGFQVLS